MTAPLQSTAYPFPHTSKRTCARPPDFHKDGYVVETDGGCLEPIVFHGELLAVEPVLPEPGEFACFFFKGAESGAVKLNTKPIHGFPLAPKSELIPLIEAMQFSPAKQYASWANEIIAIHRVQWVMREGEWQSANDLLRGFDWKALLRRGMQMPARNVATIQAVQS